VKEDTNILPTPKNSILEQLGFITQEVVSLCRTRRSDEPLELSSVRREKAANLEASLRRTAANARQQVRPGSTQLADVLDSESSAYESLSSLYDEGEAAKAKLAKDARTAFDQSLQIRMRGIGTSLGEAAADDDQRLK
jgi:hypothetical protein